MTRFRHKAPSWTIYYKRKRRAKIPIYLFISVIYILFVSLTLVLRSYQIETDNDIPLHTRNKRDLYDVENNEESLAAKKNCTERSIHQFPDNFMSLYDTQHGGVAVHILIALYLFGALAVVCDDYFVQSLERICSDLGLQEDVAGATFMAAGSSAPELATSVIGVFIAKSDVGVGTIVGSAVFNILVIIGLVGLLAGIVIELTWYPLMRDCVCYLLTVVALIVVIQDSQVYWYEAMVMLIMYVLYIVLMYFNRRLEDKAIEVLARLRQKAGYEKIYDEKEPILGNDMSLPSDNTKSNHVSGAEKDRGPGRNSLSSIEAESIFGSSTEQESQEIEVRGETHPESPWALPSGFFARVFWILMIPIKVLLFCTVPDCRNPGIWRRLYPLTFIMSIIWISAFSYIMVWMIIIAGDALGIPDTVMGLTLLAAGTSIPDCLSSIFVARDGYGDMAVSNSIGSNIFDILICLGLPWLLDTVAVNTGSILEINSSGLVYSSITLLSTIVFIVIAINVSKWTLDKRMGVILLVVYVIVITLSCLYELNIFGDFNPPSCPR